MAEPTIPAGNEPAADPAAAAQAAAAVPAAGTEDLAALRREAAQAQASQRRADQLADRLKKFEDAENAARLAAAGADGQLQEQLRQAQEAVTVANDRARVAELSQQYPLAMKRLGKDALKLSDETIAGLQSDLAAGVSPENPEPIGANPARGPATQAPPKPLTSEDILAKLRTMEPWK